MRITWTGLGFLGFIIPMAMYAVASGVYGINNVGAARAALVLAAIAVWFVGTKLNRDAQEAGDDAPHQAFGYPMQWSALLAVGGIVLTLL